MLLAQRAGGGIGPSCRLRLSLVLGCGGWVGADADQGWEVKWCFSSSVIKVGSSSWS